MKEFLQNVKYTALILALVVVAGVGIVAIVDVLERWIGEEAMIGVMGITLAYLIYDEVKSARKHHNTNEK